jgi:ADP-ribose pyrophosphatase YjhB (NUDIX family)
MKRNEQMKRFKEFILIESTENTISFSNPKDRKTGKPTGIPKNDTNEINGLKFDHYKAPKDWKNVEGQNHEINEPPVPELHGKRYSSGLIMREKDGRTWLTKPTNGFGGYDHTFPKGGVERGMHAQANAIKETHEETGLKGRITGYAGDYHGDTSVTRYYHAERTGGHPHDHGWESEAVVLAHKKDLHHLLNRDRDREIVKNHIED